VWSARCDCGEQLDEAARLMSSPSMSPSGGAIVYLRQEGRGIGLGEKLKAYNLQDLGNDTYEANLMLRHPADARSYGLATSMLVDLGLGGEAGIRLLTNNPDKVRAVEGPGGEVVVRERVAMVPIAWKTGGKEGIHSEEVEKYLSTKVSCSPLPRTLLLKFVCGLLIKTRRSKSSSICLRSSNDGAWRGGTQGGGRGGRGVWDIFTCAYVDFVDGRERARYHTTAATALYIRTLHLSLVRTVLRNPRTESKCTG
jgi:GTP cyclohydrolase II